MFDSLGRNGAERETKYKYDSLHRTTSVALPASGTLDPLFAVDDTPLTETVYDDNGNVVRVTEKNLGTTLYATFTFDRLTETTFDALDRPTLVQRTDPDSSGLVTVYGVNEYDGNGNVLREQDALNRETTHTYDGLNRLVKTTLPAAPVYDAATDSTSTVATSVEYAYNDASELVSQTDQRGLTTTLGHDALGRTTSITQPTVSGGTPVTLMKYDAVGNLRFVYDPNQSGAQQDWNRTEFGYDEWDQRVKTIGAAPVSSAPTVRPTTEVTYDSNGNQTSVKDPNDNVTSFEYDTHDRLTKITQPATADHAAPVTQFKYSAAGNRTEVILVSSNSRTTVTEYDNLDRPILVQDPTGRVSETYYLTSGLVGKTVMASGSGAPLETSYDFDQWGRVTRTNQVRGSGSNELTVFEYDLANNLKSIKDSADNETTYVYDALNRRTSEQQVGVGSRAYGYDAVGNLRLFTDRRGRMTRYDYDALNRQTSEAWLGASGNGYVANYTYDLAGNLLLAEDSQATVGSAQYSSVETVYDNLYRPRTVIQDAANTAEAIFTYTHDLNGNRTSTAVTVNGLSRYTNAFTFDALNRTTLIQQYDNTNPTGSATVHAKAVGFEYDADGQMAKQFRYESFHTDASAYVPSEAVSKTVIEHDAQTGRLESIFHYGVSTGTTTAVPLTKYIFTYDANSRIDLFTTQEFNSGVQAGQATVLDYDYDWMGQVTKTTTTIGSSLPTVQNFDYDNNGNQAGAELGPHNRLLDDGTYTYQYDNEGNRTRREHKTTGEVTTYSWDHRNRLVAVSINAPDTASDRVVRFEYDVFNRRIEKHTTYDINGSVVDWHYVNDGASVAFVLGENDEVTRLYLWGAGIDQPVAAEVFDAEVAPVTWMLTDHQGTVRDYYGKHPTTGVYTINTEVGYDSFGKPVDPPLVAFLYAGQEYDRETGLQYSRARYYDPVSRGFISQDPIGFAGGDTNLYRRVGNSPINATDPSGNVANVAIGAGTGAVVGAGAYFYQYVTGGIKEFSWADLGVYTAGGMAAGAVAGATFGLSLAAGGAVTGSLGLTTGTAGAAVTASVTLGLTGAVAGGAGGFVTGVGLTAARGGTAGEIAMGGIVGAGRGAFYGGISGAAGGVVLPFTAFAGIGFGGGMLGGSFALGSSAMVGDVVAQALGNVVGLQRGYDPAQTVFAGLTASIFGGYSGRRDPGLTAFASGFRSLMLFHNQKPQHATEQPRQLFTPEQVRGMPGRRLIYVVLEDLTLIIGRRSSEPGGGHIDLARGRPVRAAGEVIIRGGQVKSIDNRSGHYLPKGRLARQAAEQAFKKAGFEVRGKYIEFTS
jgi:RHS repeat-associated protein